MNWFDFFKIQGLSARGFFNWLPDEIYLKLLFRARLGQKLDLDDPQTFNEKIQWLKLYDRKPKYTIMVDKYRVREYVARKIGEEYLIPLLGVWDDPDEIDFDKLPGQFVLKCNHNSGIGMCICKNKSKLDIDKVKSELRKGIKQNYYWGGREWPYKNVQRKIVCEKFMKDKNSSEGLTDYKFYCFNGKPQFLYISAGLDNHDTAKISFLNLDWTFAPFGRTDYNSFDKLPPKPEHYEKMLDIAHILSDGIPFLRVDLYEINGKIYFGELTFSPCCGFMSFVPQKYDLKVGQILELPKKRV